MGKGVTNRQRREHARSQVPEIIRMLKEGVPMVTIQKELNVSSNFVIKIRDENGLSGCVNKKTKDGGIPEWLWKQWDDFINSLKHPISIKIK